MPSFTVLYTKPEHDADAFVQEYRLDHLAIADRFPNMEGYTTTIFTGTPRGGDAPYFLMFHGTWASQEDMDEAMRHPSLMEASRHAMGMLQKYGNRAEMLIGE